MRGPSFFGTFPLPSSWRHKQKGNHVSPVNHEPQLFPDSPGFPSAVFF